MVSRSLHHKETAALPGVLPHHSLRSRGWGLPGAQKEIHQKQFHIPFNGNTVPGRQNQIQGSKRKKYISFNV